MNNLFFFGVSILVLLISVIIMIFIIIVNIWLVKDIFVWEVVNFIGFLLIVMFIVMVVVFVFFGIVCGYDM